MMEFTPLPTQGILSHTFTTLITPLINLFTSTLSSLSALIKRSLHKYTFLALSAYTSLSALQGRWDDVMCSRPGRKENELKEGLHSIRASCLRSFPEFLADIRAAALGKGGELSTGLADFTLSVSDRSHRCNNMSSSPQTVQYVERLPEVKLAVSTALLTLGDGNWKMGEGVQVGQKAPKVVDIDDQTIVEHYMCECAIICFTFIDLTCPRPLVDVVNTVVASLSTLSRTNKRPAFGSIFLINNVSFLRTRILIQPRTDIPSLLSKPTQDALNSAFRTAKAGYFDSNFSPLMQTLLEDKDKSKSATKEKFTKFFDALEEVAERHRLARVLQDDRDGRETIQEEAVKLVVPSLQRFTQRTAGKEFSKNPQKYIKMSAEEVENLIRSFYA